MLAVQRVREAGHLRDAVAGEAVPVPGLPLLHLHPRQGRAHRPRQDQAVQGKGIPAERYKETNGIRKRQKDRGNALIIEDLT